MITYRFLLVLTVLALCAGCARPRYRMAPLKPVNKRAAFFSETKEGVKIRLKMLSQEQTNKLFKGRGKRLKKSRRGCCIVPLQCTLKNYTSKVVTLCKQDIDLPVINYKEVARRMFASTTKRVAALTAVGISCMAITFAGSCVCGLAGAMSGLPIFIAASYGTGAISGAFLIGTPVVTYLHATGSRQVNQLMCDDLEQKTVGDTLTINPFSEETFLMFIAEKDLKNRFAITVKKEDSCDLVFAIDLNQ